MFQTIVAQTAGAETLTWFVAHVLLAVACLGTAVYSRANERYSQYDPLMWRYLALSALVGAVYATIAIVEPIVASFAIGEITIGAVRRLTQMFFIIFLALAMRELYFQTPNQSSDDDLLSIDTVRRIETIFLLVIFGQFLVVIFFGLVGVARVIHLFASVVFTIYGVTFALGIRSNRMASGTVLDSMVTYVIAVLLTLGIASAIVVVGASGVVAAAAESAVNVLTVMGASFLLVLIIRLKQNVDAARPSR